MAGHHGASTHSGRERVVLESVPSLGALYARAAGSTVTRGASAGVRRALKGLPVPLPGKPRGRKPELRLPAVELAVAGIEAGAARHEAFCEVVGARPRPSSSGKTEVFSGYLHALAFPVAMALLTRDDFPLPTVGLVHLANSVEHTAPVFTGERLDALVWAEGLRPHRAGAAFDVVVELRRPSGEDDGGAASGDATLDGPGLPWARPVWAGRSTYLARGVTVDPAGGADGTEDRSGPVEGHERPEFVPSMPTARWRLGPAAGREYAAVSGDVNPIHLSAPSARALGMKGAIAHGMYTASRALAMLDAPVPLRWEVDFGAPLVLPAAPAVAVERDGRGSDLHEATVTVWDTRKRRPYATLQLHR